VGDRGRFAEIDVRTFGVGPAHAGNGLPVGGSRNQRDGHAQKKKKGLVGGQGQVSAEHFRGRGLWLRRRRCGFGFHFRGCQTPGPPVRMKELELEGVGFFPRQPDQILPRQMFG